MASIIKAFLLSLLISFSCSQNCQIPNLWNSFQTSVEEDIKVNELFLEIEDENSQNITSVRWTNLDDASPNYFEFTKVGNGWGIKVLQEITDAVDCVSNFFFFSFFFQIIISNFQKSIVEISASDLIIPFNFEVTCSDGSTLEAYSDIYVLDVNNKAPKFNQRDYVLNGVSKRLPAGVDLLKVYPDKIDLFIQDIDRNGQGQLDEEFVITIEEPADVFEVVLGTPYDQVSQTCQDLQSQEMFKTFPIQLKIKNQFPSNLGSSYQFTLKTADVEGNEDSVDFTIGFSDDEDLLPPTFNETFYYSDIPQPIFNTDFQLQIQPNDIAAYDDNDKMTYIIEDDICSKSFQLEQNGKVTWIGAIDPKCPKNDNIYLEIKACQETPVDRCSKASLTIRVLGIQKEPKFEQNGYHAEKLQLTVSQL